MSLQGVADDLIREARRLPGAETEVSMGRSHTGNTRFARSEVTSTGDADDLDIGVTVAFGKRAASVTLNQSDPSSLREAVARAARLARLAPENPERLPLLGPQRYLPAAPGYDAAIEKLPAAARADAVAGALDAAAQAGVEIAGFYQHQAGEQILMNSAGLRAASRFTWVDLSMTARTSDGTGSGWATGHADRLAELAPAGITRAAIDKAVRSQQPRRLDAGRYTVVLEPAAVAELLGFFTSALDARPADEGRSFFAKPGGGTKLGEQLFADVITLRSDPADPALPTAAYDGEGFPLRPITWVDHGKLNALSCSRYWAQKSGKAPTGEPAGYHLLGGAATLEELIKGVDRGVLITRFWYSRWLDPQAMLATGLTRDGVFLIEKGEIVHPVNNFRWNESPVTLLANAEALGRETVRIDAGTRCPAIRSHGFNLASISEAV